MPFCCTENEGAPVSGGQVNWGVIEYLINRLK